MTCTKLRRALSEPPPLRPADLEYLDLTRVYDAQADGWTADAFHAGARAHTHRASGDQWRASGDQ